MNILATGFGSSFGKYIGDKLREQGHKVFSVGRETTDDCVIDFNHMTSGRRAYVMVERAFDMAESQFGGFVECVINHAGITHIDYIEDHSLEDFQKVINVNLVTPFLFSRELAIRVSKFNPKSPDDPYRLIFTGSMAAKQGFRACPAYPASKAALHQMAIGLAKEFAGRHPITVLVVAPGSVDDSGMKSHAIQELIRTRKMTPEEAEAYNSKSAPLGYITHEEVWNVFDFAVNQAPPSMSGSVLYIPGAAGI